MLSGVLLAELPPLRRRAALADAVAHEPVVEGTN
jgi:hypothetical protein